MARRSVLTMHTCAQGASRPPRAPLQHPKETSAAPHTGARSSRRPCAGPRAGCTAGDGWLTLSAVHCGASSPHRSPLASPFPICYPGTESLLGQRHLSWSKMHHDVNRCVLTPVGSFCQCGRNIMPGDPTTQRDVGAWGSKPRFSASSDHLFSDDRI